MSDNGAVSEFDPLAVPKSTPGQSALPNKDEKRDATANEISTKSTVLDEFDPLTNQEEAKKGQVSHFIKQSSATPVATAQTTITLSTSQSNGNGSSTKPTQSHSSSHSSRSHVDKISSKPLESAHILDISNIKKEEGTAATVVSLSVKSETNKSDRIGAEISQIDSVLKALNMGQYDLSTLTSLTSATAKPQSQETYQLRQPKQV